MKWNLREIKMPVSGSFGGDLYYQVAELQGLLVLTVASEHSPSEESQSDSPNCAGFCKSKRKRGDLSNIPVLQINHTIPICNSRQAKVTTSRDGDTGSTQIARAHNGPTKGHLSPPQ